MLPTLAVLAVVGASCESDDETDDPTGETTIPSPGGPAGVEDGSTTTSLPGPQYTPAPNPDAGGGGAVTSAP